MKDTPRRCAKCGKPTAKYPSLSMYRFPKPGSWNIRRVEAWAKYIHPDENWTSNDLHQKLYREVIKFYVKITLKRMRLSTSFQGNSIDMPFPMMLISIKCHKHLHLQLRVLLNKRISLQKFST